MRIIKLANIGVLLSAVMAVSLPQAVFASETLDKLVAQKAAIMERLHFKAKKALVTAAQDKAFDHYFHAHTHEERDKLKPRIDEISLAVQDRFHVEEMCLIDPKGAEISRIVGREVADDLADDETGAVFFTPGFEKPARKVYVSPIYMSVDANKWVVAYVTPVVVDGDKKAILHYEHTLRSFQDNLNKRVDGGTVLLAVDAEGFVISDSRKAIAIDKAGDSEDRADYFDRFELSGLDLAALRSAAGGDDKRGSGTVSAGGSTFSVAYQQVEDMTILAYRAE
mgnify:CR=1 FL=1